MITKTGGRMAAEAAGQAGPRGWRLAKGIARLGLKATPHVYKGMLLAGKGLIGAGKGVLKGGYAVGKQMAKHPGATLPAAAIGGITAYNLPERAKANAYHVNPNANLTRTTWGGIDYAHPQLAHHARHTRMFY